MKTMATRTIDLLASINRFLVTHTVDRETLEFLSDLKRQILELEDQVSMGVKPSKRKELTKIEALLRALGKRAFIDCYEIFKAAAAREISQVAEAISECSGAKTANSLRTKASVGVKIFKEGLQRDALEIISQANKVDPEVRMRAEQLLKEEA